MYACTHAPCVAQDNNIIMYGWKKMLMVSRCLTLGHL